MEELNRTKNVTRNLFSGLFSKVALFAFAFANRTVFIHTLGAEYAGISGLFTNILSVLCMADLGISSVLMFNLYSALKQNDRKLQNSLVFGYRRIYYAVSIAIIVIGGVLVPFLPYIVKASVNMSEIRLYYILYLINISVSYCFAYKTIVLIADQKRYYDNIVSSAVQISLHIMQMIYLVFFRDFVGYLLLQVICTVAKNVILTCITNRKYPYLRKAVSTVQSIDVYKLFNDTKATFIYKVGTVILNNTDNVLISMLIGTVYVGYYSNYYMLIHYVSGYLFVLQTSLVASVGNLNAGHEDYKSVSIFYQTDILFTLLSCLCGALYINCIQQFIPLWIGSKYLLDIKAIIIMVVVFMMDNMFIPVEIYRETLGLFEQVKYTMIPAVIINIVMSVILGKRIGISGILMATFISKATTIWWYELVLVCKTLGENMFIFLLRRGKCIVFCVLTVVISFLACMQMDGDVLGIVKRGLITLFAVVIMGTVFWYSDTEFKKLLARVKIIQRLKC